MIYSKEWGDIKHIRDVVDVAVEVDGTTEEGEMEGGVVAMAAEIVVSAVAFLETMGKAGITSTISNPVDRRRPTLSLLPFRDAVMANLIPFMTP